jgi:hypothetical protein
MNAFLWTGTDVMDAGNVWFGIQRARDLGGLGVLDLKLFDIALRLRWLWVNRTGLMALTLGR